MIRRIERADGVRFQAYGRRGGQKVYIGTYLSRQEAIAAEEDHRVTERKIAEGKLPPRTDARLTFAVGAKRWLAMLEETSSRSHEEYARRVELHLNPAFGGVPIVDIRKADVLAWRDRLSQGELSAKTVNTLLGTLSSAFSFFIGREWLEHNPCRGVRNLKVQQKLFPWLTSNEMITKLLAECTPNIQSLVAVLVGTGMRLDEALHLRWEDVDFEHRLITVHRGRKGTTKSGKVRRVPIFDSVLAVLEQMKLARGSNALLWPGGKPGKPLTQPAVHRPFKRALDHAEMPAEMRLHDLRHSFASLFLIDGGDIFKLSRILGHSSVAITERTYAHLKPDAFEEDYGRVAFRFPRGGKVLAFPTAGDNRETAKATATAVSRSSCSR